MKKQIILFVLLLSLMTAGVFSLQNTIGYASESSGRKIVTIVFDDSFSMAQRCVKHKEVILTVFLIFCEDYN